MIFPPNPRVAFFYRLLAGGSSLFFEWTSSYSDWICRLPLYLQCQEAFAIAFALEPAAALRGLRALGTWVGVCICAPNSSRQHFLRAHADEVQRDA